MKIFLSWHGSRSRAIAEALNDWLPRVIQAVRPFFSPEIEKGAKWSGELDAALEGTSFGVVCLTPGNLDSTWIHYETGALSKTKDSLIWTYLTDLEYSDVPQPLGKFQHTLANKPDTLKLLRVINSRLRDVGGDSLKDQLLEENFELYWPKLNALLNSAASIDEGTRKIEDSAKDSERDVRDILGEILEIVRDQASRSGVLVPKWRPDRLWIHTSIDVSLEPHTQDESKRTFMTRILEDIPLSILSEPADNYLNVFVGTRMPEQGLKDLIETAANEAGVQIAFANFAQLKGA